MSVSGKGEPLPYSFPATTKYLSHFYTTPVKSTIPVPLHFGQDIKPEPPHSLQATTYLLLAGSAGSTLLPLHFVQATYLLPLH
jgi:hypothetical protein